MNTYMYIHVVLYMHVHCILLISKFMVLPVEPGCCVPETGNWNLFTVLPNPSPPPRPVLVPIPLVPLPPDGWPGWPTMYNV